MAITIQTSGTRDTDEAMKNSRFGDADVVIADLPTKPADGDGKEAKAAGDKEEKPPEQKEEKEDKSEKDDKKAAAKAGDKDKDDDGFPKEAVDQIAKLRRQRREAREEAEDLKAENARLKKAGESGGTATAEPEQASKTYSGKPEPTIDTFTADPEKYPDPYAALSKAYGMWAKEEAKAELRFEQAKAEQDEAAAEQAQQYEESRAKIEEIYPDLDELIHSDVARKVRLSEGVVRAIKESPVGPAVLRHLILNPEVAAGWLKKPEVSQVAAYGKLEVIIEAEIETLTKAKTGEGKDDKKKDDPPPKKKSSAPDPPDRLKPSGDGKQTAKELAGPSDNHVNLVNVNLAEYERKRRHEGYQP